MCDDAHIIDMTPIFKAVSDHEQQHIAFQKELNSLRNETESLRESLRLDYDIRRDADLKIGSIVENLETLTKRVSLLEKQNNSAEKKDASPRRAVNQVTAHEMEHGEIGSKLGKLDKQVSLLETDLQQRIEALEKEEKYVSRVTESWVSNIKAIATAHNDAKTALTEKIKTLENRCQLLERHYAPTDKNVIRVNVLAVCNLLGIVPCAFCAVGNLGVSIEPCKSCSIYQKVLASGELPSNFILKEELR